MRSYLGALDLDETRGYIDCRLHVAGCTSSAELFPTETVVEVHRQSRGIPRLINTICENALIHGYAAQSKNITPDNIKEVAADFRLNVVHPSTSVPAGPNGHSAEVERAAKTLLDLYASLRNARELEPEMSVAVGPGARKQ